MLEILNSNKEWVFSGIGVLAISLVISVLLLIIRKSKKNGRKNQTDENIILSMDNKVTNKSNIIYGNKNISINIQNNNDK